MNLPEVIISTLLGFSMSFVSWWILFHVLSPKIQISPLILRLVEKHDVHSIAKNNYYYRIISHGSRPVINIEIVEKIAIKLSDPNFANSWESFILKKSGSDTRNIPLLRIGKTGESDLAHTISIRTNEIDVNRLENVPKAEVLLNILKTRPLTFDDFLNHYQQGEIQFRVYVSCTDSLSGSRKLFWKVYEPKDVKNGRFKQRMEHVLF